MRIILSECEITDKFRKRFWAKVNRSMGVDECWPWLASTGFRNYGKFKINDTYVTAHRVAYFLAFGPFDESLNVNHKCDNPVCCNPYHLYVGTQADNNTDVIKRHRYDMRRCGHPLFTDVGTIQEIRQLHSQKVSMREIAKRYNCSSIPISNIIHRRYCYA